MHNFAAITFGEMSLHFARSMNSQMFAVLSAVPPLQNISPLLRSMSLTTVARITFHPVNVAFSDLGSCPEACSLHSQPWHMQALAQEGSPGGVPRSWFFSHTMKLTLNNFKRPHISDKTRQVIC